MNCTKARLAPARQLSGSPVAPAATSWPFQAIHQANQHAAPEQEERREEEEAPATPERKDEIDEVDEASRESFPASDPPAFTPLHIGT